MRNRVALLAAGLRATGFPLHMAEAMARRIVKNGRKRFVRTKLHQHHGKAANYERGFVCSCGLDVCRCIQEGAA